MFMRCFMMMTKRLQLRPPLLSSTLLFTSQCDQVPLMFYAGEPQLPTTSCEKHDFESNRISM